MPPKNWFERMHEAAEDPEKTEALRKPPRKKTLIEGTQEEDKSPSSSPSLDWLREWEQKHDK